MAFFVGGLRLQCFADLLHGVDELVPVAHRVQSAVQRPALGVPAFAEVPAVARCLGQRTELGSGAYQVAQAGGRELLRIGLAALPLDARR